MIRTKVLIIAKVIAPSGVVGAKRFSYISQYISSERFSLFFLTLKEKHYGNIDKSIKAIGKFYRVSSGPSFKATTDSVLGKIYNKFCKYFAPIDLGSGWIVPAIIKGFTIVPKESIDVIIVTAPPFSSYIIGYFLSVYYKTKLIIDYRDPWFNNPHISTVAFRGAINSHVEKVVLKKADRVIFNNNKAFKLYRNSKYGKIIAEKSEIVTNGYLCNNNTAQKQFEDQINIVYAGNLFRERKLKYLIIPLSRLIMQYSLDLNKIKIIIYGKIDDEDKQIIDELELENIVEEYDYIPHEEILKVFQKASLLYLPQIKDGLYSIPLKFYDYLCARKPIIAVGPNDSAIEEIFNQINCGEYIEYSDEEKMFNALKKIIIDRKQYKFNSIDQFKWEKIAVKIEKIIQEICVKK